MDVSQFLGGNYLAHTDLPLPYQVWTISKVDQQVLDESPKVCVGFAEHAKSLACNKTNLTRLSELYGTDTTQWIGKQVLVYRSTTAFQGQTRRCIRLCGPTQTPPDPICDQQGNVVPFQPPQVVQQPINQPVPQTAQVQPVQAPQPQAVADPWQGQQQQNPPTQLG